MLGAAWSLIAGTFWGAEWPRAHLLGPSQLCVPWGLFPLSVGFHVATTSFSSRMRKEHRVLCVHGARRVAGSMRGVQCSAARALHPHQAALQPPPFLQPREKGRMRFHRLQNVQIALDFLKQRQVRLHGWGGLGVGVGFQLWQQQPWALCAPSPGCSNAGCASQRHRTVCNGANKWFQTDELWCCCCADVAGSQQLPPLLGAAQLCLSLQPRTHC